MWQNELAKHPDRKVCNQLGLICLMLFCGHETGLNSKPGKIDKEKKICIL